MTTAAWNREHCDAGEDDPACAECGHTADRAALDAHVDLDPDGQVENVRLVCIDAVSCAERQAGRAATAGAGLVF